MKETTEHHSHHPRNRSFHPKLEETKGFEKILYFDAFSGVSGDMTVGALLDLGVPWSVVDEASLALDIEGFHLQRGHSHKHGIVATTFEVILDQSQPFRTYQEIRTLLENSSLEEKVKVMSLKIFSTLAHAEAKVHGMEIDEVHFHEVGAVDSIVDVVCASAAISFLNAIVISSPLPISRGFVESAHGILPLPAPATLECLRGVPTYSVDLNHELVTPTGAAIISTLAQKYTRWPNIIAKYIGYGAGSRDLIDRPNVLRITLGKQEVQQETQSHFMVEASMDDITGEMVGFAMETLIESGALDVWTTPLGMKKGRPGILLSVIVEEINLSTMIDKIFNETTSIGVRYFPIQRVERPRRLDSIETPLGRVQIKISEGPFGKNHIKPEYEDCANIAKEKDLSLKEVLRIVNQSISNLEPTREYDDEP